MARKAYSEREREQVKETLQTTVIQCIVDRGLIHSSIDVLCKKVGISKAFFYTFFPSKEELVLEALRYQQPKLLQYARQLMGDPSLSWREGVETFLKNCCYGAKSGVAVLSMSSKCAIVSLRRIFRRFGKTRLSFTENCSRSLACLRTVLTHGCSAIWRWP